MLLFVLLFRSKIQSEVNDCLAKIAKLHHEEILANSKICHHCEKGPAVCVSNHFALYLHIDPPFVFDFPGVVCSKSCLEQHNKATDDMLRDNFGKVANCHVGEPFNWP